VWLDLVGVTWIGVAKGWAVEGKGLTLPFTMVCIPIPGVVLPVNPSTLRVSRHLQKFDPSGTRQEAVSDPSGFWLSPNLIKPRGVPASPYLKA
jgi:hypothetical protein